MDNFSLTEHQDEFSLEEAEQGNFSAFGDIIKGDKGDPGAVFTPSVDSNGNISWTNDGGLPNPETQNIKGPQGDPGNYTKPATGIPKTDLAEDVQTSLGKADAALPASGGTMSGAIAMGGNRITGIANGTNDQDAVTKAQLDAAVVGALKPSGSVAFASLPALSASVLNNIYNITDAFTTTSDFVEGSGKSYPAGTNVAVINTGTAQSPVYKYDVYTGVIDLSAYRTAADQDVIDAGKLGTGGDGSNVTAAFSAASSRANIATGEKLSVIFGKITKWFSDLGTAAFRAATNAITQGSTDLIESGAVYTGLAAKQGTINASGILKSDGSGGVSAATAGTDYATPAQIPSVPSISTSPPAMDGTASAGSTGNVSDAGHVHPTDTSREAAGLGLTGAAVGDLVRVAAVDANGKPTSWKHVPLCEIKTNPNLLDNWYFIGGGSQLGDGVLPINQRGQTIYTGSVKSIDRWNQVGDGIELSLADSGIEIKVADSSADNAVVQNFELNVLREIGGKVLTLSILFADGSIGATTFTVPTKTEADAYTSWHIFGTKILPNGVSIAFAVSSPTINIVQAVIRVPTDNVTRGISAIKLEIGSEQTLAHQENGQWVLNEIPDYGQELAKCQRYFIGFDDSNNYHWVAFGTMVTTTVAFVVMPTPVTMRTTPTITFNDVNIQGDTNIWLPVTSIAIQSINVNGVALSCLINSTYTAGSAVSLAGKKIYLSADL